MHSWQHGTRCDIATTAFLTVQGNVFKQNEGATIEVYTDTDGASDSDLEEVYVMYLHENRRFSSRGEHSDS